MGYKVARIVGREARLEVNGWYAGGSGGRGGHWKSADFSGDGLVPGSMFQHMFRSIGPKISGALAGMAVWSLQLARSLSHACQKKVPKIATEHDHFQLTDLRSFTSSDLHNHLTLPFDPLHPRLVWSRQAVLGRKQACKFRHVGVPGTAIHDKTDYPPKSHNPIRKPIATRQRLHRWMPIFTHPRSLHGTLEASH